VTDIPLEKQTFFKEALEGKPQQLVLPYERDIPRANDDTLRFLHEKLLPDNGKALKSLKHLAVQGCELSDEGVALLADIISHAPNLQKINFYYNQFTPEQTATLAESLQGHKHLKQLSFGHENLHSDNGELFGKVLQAVPNLESLSLSGCSLGNKPCEVLADHLPNSKINSLSLSAMGVWPEGMEKLIEGVEKSAQVVSFGISKYAPEQAERKLPLLTRAASIPHLRRIEIWENGLESSEVHKVTQAIAKNTSLDAVFLAEKKIPNDQMGQAAQKMLGANPSIKLASVKGKKNTSMSEKTRTGLQETVRAIPDFTSLYIGETRITAADSFMRDDISNRITYHDNATAAFKGLSFNELKLLTLHPKSVFHLSHNFVGPMLRAEKAFPQFIERLPGIPDSPEGWQKPNRLGFAPVDNPLLWDTPEKAKANLAAMPLNAEMLLKPSPKGMSLADAAMDTLSGEEFVRTINAQGIQLGAKELLDEKGNLSAFSNKLAYKTPYMRAAFIAENWLGKKPSEMRRVFSAMPDYVKENLPLHSLEQQMRRHAPTQTSIGR